jgi:hypothetical protein
MAMSPEEYQARVRKDPELMALFDQYNDPHSGMSSSDAEPVNRNDLIARRDERLQALGLANAVPEGYQLGGGGELTKQPGWLARNWPLLLMGGAAVAPAALGVGAAGAGAGAAGAGAVPTLAASSTLPAITGGTAVSLGGGAAAGAGAAAAGTGAGVAGGGGFWSSIAKMGTSYLKGQVPGAGGGWGSALRAGGSLLSGMANASAQNRGEADRFNQNQDALRLRMEQEKRESQNNAYRNALRGALAKNMQDASFDRSQLSPSIPVIKLGGGARPSAIGAEGRGAGDVLNRQAMLELMNPSTPKLSEQKQAGFWEKLAGPLALGMTAYGEMADRSTPGSAGSSIPRLNVSTDPNLMIRGPRLMIRRPGEGDDMGIVAD